MTKTSDRPGIGKWSLDFASGALTLCREGRRILGVAQNTQTIRLHSFQSCEILVSHLFSFGEDHGLRITATA